MHTDSRLGYVDPEQTQWAARVTRAIPEPWKTLAKKHWREAIGTKTWAEANADLLARVEELRPHWLRLAESDAAVNSSAETLARAVSLARLRQPDPAKLAELIERACARLEIKPPAARLKTSGPEPAIARAADPRWWRRRLRAKSAQAIEHAAAALGAGPDRAQPYCTDATVRRRKQQHARNAATLAGLLAVSDRGERIAADELAAAGQANPANRSAEMLVRLRGIERTAAARGDACAFVTITAPGYMHPRAAGSTVPNPNYAGTTPTQAHKHLAACWARARAALARLNITARGIRVVEPHKDGTPHWHMLVWLPPDQMAPALDVMRAHALRDAPDEPGAQAHRFKVEHIDPARGSAIGYVIKYLAKHLPSKGSRTVGDDADEGDAAPDTRERIDAWAAVWGIRRFQFFGIAPVTIWRELRRRLDDDTPDPGETLARAATAAETPDWSAFEQIAGPVPYHRAGARIHRWEEPPEPNRPDGRALDRYDEPKPDRLVGLTAADGRLKTRTRTWQIIQNPMQRAA